MFRIIAAACRANSRYCTLGKVNDNVVFTNIRYLSSVQQADEKAKEEARKALEAVTSVIGRRGPHSSTTEPEYNEEFVKKHVDFLNRKEIDSWEIRRLIHELVDYDCVPDVEIIKACLKACRRLNDYALAIRFMEVVKDKCGEVETWYAYILQEIQPTLDELGINTVEELGYDKPELAVMDVDDIH